MSRQAERLRRLLYPRSIVYVGGGSVGPAIAYTRKLGFTGELYAINPHRDDIGGIPCVNSAADLPESPDVAFVLVPGASAADAVRDLARAGVGAAVVASSGFAEAGRRDLEVAVIEAAGDMPLLGPNSPGVSNFLDGVSVMLDNMGMHTCERGIAVVSNGGAYMTDMACSDRSLPIALMVGLGNQGAVTIADMLEVVLDDDRVTAVNLYFESLYDVARLSEAALKAYRKDVPVVVLKAGRTEAGTRAATTHTAAMTGDAVIASALFRRLGFIEVETGSEAMETLKMLSIASRPNGRRVGFATSSGTYAAIGADLAEQAGLVLPAISPDRRGVLQPLMEPFSVPNNPIDLATAQFWSNDDQRRLFDAFLASGFDIALQCMSFPAEDTWDDESWYRSSRIFAESARAAGLPAVFVSSVHEGLPGKARDMLTGLGVAPLQGFHDGLRAVSNAVRQAEAGGRAAAAMRLPEPHSLPGPGVPVDEAAAKELLRKAGVPTPAGVVWTGPEPPSGITYPVALKLCDACVTHKSEFGGVVLDISSADELLAARQRMLEAACRRGLQVDRFLVESMIEEGVGELLIGLRHVGGIGQALTIASGGIGTELLGDSETLLLPATRIDVQSALHGLKLFPLLDGWRGCPKADIEAAIDAVMSVCAFAEAHRETLLELEINPLILRTEGHGACAADAVLRFTGNTIQ